jgi:hypothetical protein
MISSQGGKNIQSGAFFPDEENIGISRREWYAGMAMQGYVSTEHASQVSYKHIVRWSYALADAMIEEGVK